MRGAPVVLILHHLGAGGPNLVRQPLVNCTHKAESRAYLSASKSALYAQSLSKTFNLHATSDSFKSLAIAILRMIDLVSRPTKGVLTWDQEYDNHQARQEGELDLRVQQEQRHTDLERQAAIKESKAFCCFAYYFQTCSLVDEV